MNKNRPQAFILCIMLATLSLNLTAQNWPQWRGPQANGIAEAGDYPTAISLENNLLWKIQMPGPGGSTPIVWNDRIILTAAVGDSADAEDGVICYDWAGNEVWTVTLGREIPGKHPRGSGSSPSAVTDGKRIFVLFKTTTLAALDFNGQILWKTNLQNTFGEIVFWWDFGTSPVLVDDKVVVALQNEGDSYLLALDQATGEVVWKVDRNYDCSPESAQSYTTPVVINQGNQTQIVVWGADHLTGHDAKTGEMQWSYSGFNPENKQYWRTIASPAISGNIAVIPYGRGRFLAGVNTRVSGNHTENEWLWSQTGIGSDVATPLIFNDQVYILGFNGKLWCLNLADGTERWQLKLPDHKGLFYSSPTLAVGHLFMCSDEGTFYSARIKPDGLEILTQVQFEDNFVATPVLVQNKILLRGTQYLYCLGIR